MVEAGSAHVSRLTDSMRGEQQSNARSKELLFDLEEVQYELLRAKRRLDELERGLEDSAS